METGASVGLLPMDESHCDACAALLMDVFTNPPWSYDWLKQDKMDAYVRDLLRTPGFRGFVLLQKGMLRAACLGVEADYFAAPTYEIKEILVTRELQGHGVGSAFLSGIEAALAADGRVCVTLNTQRSIPAFRFYEKHGYAVSPETVMMSKLL